MSILARTLLTPTPTPTPYPSYGGPSSGDIATGTLVILAVYCLILAVVLIAVYVVTGITLSRFFRKVGVEPWVAWVPIYNTWKWLEVGGQHGAFALLQLIPYGGIVTSVFLYIGMWRTGRAFGKESSWLVLGIFLPFVWCWLLGDEKEQYHPEAFAYYGWPPPRAGYGAVPR